MSANGPEVKMTLTGDSSQAVAAVQALQAAMQQGSNISQAQFTAFEQVTKSARDQTRAMSTLRQAYQLQHMDAFEDINVLNQTASVVQNLASMYLSLQYTILQHQISMQQLSAATATVSMNTTVLAEVTRTYGANSIQAIQASQQLVQSMYALKEQQAQAKLATDSYYGSLIQTGGGLLQAGESVGALISQLYLLQKAGVISGGTGDITGTFADIEEGAVGISDAIPVFALATAVAYDFATQGLQPVNQWWNQIKQNFESGSQLKWLGDLGKAFGSLGNLHIDATSIFGGGGGGGDSMMSTLEGWGNGIVKLFNSIPAHATTMLAGAQFAMSNLHGEFTKGLYLISNDWTSSWNQLGQDISSTSSTWGSDLSLGALKSDFDSWKSTFGTDWNNFWNGLGLGSLGSDITTAWNNAVSGLSKSFNASFAPLKTDWNDFWNGLPSAISALPGEISSAVAGIFSGLTSTFNKSFAPLRSDWTDFWTALPNVIKALPGQIGSAVANIFSGMTNTFNRSFAPLRIDWNDFWNLLPNAISSLPSEISSAISGIFAGITDTFNKSFAPLKTDWTDFWTTIVSAVVGAANNIINPLNTFISALDKVISGINSLSSILHLPQLPTIPTIPTLSAGQASSAVGNAGQYYSVMSPSGASSPSAGGNSVMVNITVQGSLITQSQLMQDLNQLFAQQFFRTSR